MIVLGVDPGERHVGWALLEITDNHARCAGLGELDPNGYPAGIAIALRGLARARSVAVVGVEDVREVNARPGFGSTMARGLVRSNRVGGRVAQALEDIGLAVHEPTAEEWHQHFFDARAVDARAVAALITSRVAGWPTKSNPHKRDAAAIALYAAHLARARTLGAEGAPVERRSP